VLCAALLLPLAAQAQNIAIVNGKPVPKARAEALLQQAVRQGQQQTPEIEQQCFSLWDNGSQRIV